MGNVIVSVAGGTVGGRPSLTFTYFYPAPTGPYAPGAPTVVISRVYATVTGKGKRVIRSGNATWGTTAGAVNYLSVPANCAPAVTAGLNVLLSGGSARAAVSAAVKAGAYRTPAKAAKAYGAVTAKAYAAYNVLYRAAYPLPARGAYLPGGAGTPKPAPLALAALGTAKALLSARLSAAYAAYLAATTG